MSALLSPRVLSVVSAFLSLSGMDVASNILAFNPQIGPDVMLVEVSAGRGMAIVGLYLGGWPLSARALDRACGRQRLERIKKAHP